MKTIITGFFLTPLFFLSCNNPDKNNTGLNNGQPINCYKYASETDTIELKLIHVGEAITGTLVYKLREKDKNVGTIQGKMINDILVADYTFQSEGVRSVRQVSFKKFENGFIEGFGDITTTGDSARFTNIDSLGFNDKFKLAEIKCQ
jgi:hypothetical protein